MSKGENFPEIQKDISGYYYLLDVISYAHHWNFRNKTDFFSNLSYVVQMFPVMNNGRIHHGDYSRILINFKDYIKAEFGVVPANHIYWKRFWTYFLLWDF